MEFVNSVLYINECNYKTTFPSKLSNRLVIFESENTIGDHYQSNFSIKHVLSGLERYFLKDKEIELSTGQSLFVDNGSMVNVESKGRCMAIFLEQDLLDEVLKIWGKGKIKKSPFTFGNKNMTISVMEKIKPHLNENERILLNEEFFYLVAEEFVFHQIGLLNCNDLCHGDESVHGLTHRVLKARDYIYDNRTEKITLDDVALAACVSKYHLLRTFRSIFGITPLHLHLRLKTMLAKEYMESNGTSITQIAEKLKYPDLQSFSRQFKLLTGKTPTEYYHSDSILLRAC